MQLPLAAPQMMLPPPPPRGQMFMPPPMEWLIMQHDMSIARNNTDGRGEVVSQPLPRHRTTGFAVGAAQGLRADAPSTSASTSNTYNIFENTDGRGEVVSQPLPTSRTTRLALAAATSQRTDAPSPPPQHLTLTTSLR
ncbi:Hypothetical predicted protein [Olea europaea subsp. europaea]|uniref:Uncharacterized protein n=1 Tax=Olea europaea subsp. europaea TaxID=158383 RepID=A0A8S0TMT4_OLEEU|nr:Hypothetical predicted protein [Olea europaea subsp. europaea]